MLVAAINAFVSIRQGLPERTGPFLDEAIASRRPTDTRSATDFLARILFEAGRLADALPLLQELFDADTPTLECVYCWNALDAWERKRSSSHVPALYDRGFRDWDFTEFESQYLEDHDYQKAITRLQEFIAANPDHRLARLRLASVAMR